MSDVKAIIADDEAPLRQFLRARLAEVWIGFDNLSPDRLVCVGFLLDSSEVFAGE